jgi:hypothetical protein
MFSYQFCIISDYIFTLYDTNPILIKKKRKWVSWFNWCEILRKCVIQRTNIWRNVLFKKMFF